VSWDIFVQDIPPSVASIQDMPDDFRPANLGPRDDLIRRISEVVPEADFSDPSWGLIDGDTYSIEVNIGDDHTVDSFAFHVRGGNEAASVVARILDHLKLRAFDPQSDSGIFSPGPAALESLRKWRAYRDQVAGDGT